MAAEAVPAQGAVDTRRVEAAQVGAGAVAGRHDALLDVPAQGIGHNQLLATGAALGLGQGQWARQDG